jgi:hypothetical protein
MYWTVFSFQTMLSGKCEAARRTRKPAIRKLERADSVQDVRHRFVANFTADAPQHSFLRNFEFSSIINLQSARPFTLFVGNDINGDTNPVTDRVGWSPRNSYRGDPLYAFDLRLSRLIHINERMALNLGVDAFNVFNRQNVNEVTSVYGGGHTRLLWGRSHALQRRCLPGNPTRQGGFWARWGTGGRAGAESPFRYAENHVQPTATADLGEVYVLNGGSKNPLRHHRGQRWGSTASKRP